jgi:hypothetical protein
MQLIMCNEDDNWKKDIYGKDTKRKKKAKSFLKFF